MIPFLFTPFFYVSELPKRFTQERREGEEQKCPFFASPSVETYAAVTHFLSLCLKIAMSEETKRKKEDTVPKGARRTKVDMNKNTKYT